MRLLRGVGCGDKGLSRRFPEFCMRMWTIDYGECVIMAFIRLMYSVSKLAYSWTCLRRFYSYCVQLPSDANVCVLVPVARFQSLGKSFSN